MFTCSYVACRLVFTCKVSGSTCRLVVHGRLVFTCMVRFNTCLCRLVTVG